MKEYLPKPGHTFWAVDKRHNHILNRTGAIHCKVKDGKPVYTDDSGAERLFSNMNQYRFIREV